MSNAPYYLYGARNGCQARRPDHWSTESFATACGARSATSTWAATPSTRLARPASRASPGRVRAGVAPEGGGGDGRRQVHGRDRARRDPGHERARRSSRPTKVRGATRRWNRWPSSSRRSLRTRRRTCARRSHGDRGQCARRSTTARRRSWSRPRSTRGRTGCRSWRASRRTPPARGAAGALLRTGHRRAEPDAEGRHDDRGLRPHRGERSLCRAGARRRHRAGLGLEPRRT